MQTEPGKWAPANIVAGYLILLGAAYFDSMRGPLVPVLVQSLHLPYAKVGWFLTIGNIVAVILLGLLNPAFRRFGEKRVGIATCLLAAVAGLIAPWVVDYPTLILLGVVIGGSIALMGAICNIYTLRGTPDAWKSRMLAGNHFMYGLGSFGAPLIVSATIARGIDWSWLVVGGALFFFVLGLYIARAVPHVAPSATTETRGNSDKAFEYFVVILFALYVVGEVTSAMWLVTYLTSSLGYSVADASDVLASVFFMMALTRIVCFAFVRQSWEKPLLWAAIVLPLAANLVGRMGFPWAFGLMGLFGPFFPLFLARVSRMAPNLWRSLTVKVMFSIQLALAIFHTIVGLLTDHFGIQVAYAVPPVVFTVVLVLLGIYFRKERVLLGGT